MSKLKTAIYALNSLKETSARLNAPHGPLLKRFLYLYGKRKFSPREIFFNGLLDPRIPEKALENYLSKEEQISFDRKYVLNTYMCMTSDKAVFYPFCMAAGVPIPKLLAIFDLPAGWTRDGRLLESSADWRLLLQSLPHNFIVKPALGLEGRGVTAFHREDNQFVDQNGYHRTIDELYKFLCQEREHNLFAGHYSHHSLRLSREVHKSIIQERVYAHPSINELTGSEALCTCRFMTFTDNSMKTDFLCTAFRLVSGNNIIDNLDKGSHGNIWCSVDYETGCITEAFAKPENADRLELIARHATTDREIVGFHIPYWAEAARLALRLAAIFHPQQVITWDIGIAPDGPVVIEGNLGAGVLPTPLRRPVKMLLTDG